MSLYGLLVTAKSLLTNLYAVLTTYVCARLPSLYYSNGLKRAEWAWNRPKKIIGWILNGNSHKIKWPRKHISSCTPSVLIIGRLL